jgi:hypothetical protein
MKRRVLVASKKMGAMRSRELDGSIFLDMAEMSCRGLAEVVSIEPCPPIETGGGRIVTGAFAHSSGDFA